MAHFRWLFLLSLIESTLAPHCTEISESLIDTSKQTCNWNNSGWLDKSRTLQLPAEQNEWTTICNGMYVAVTCIYDKMRKECSQDMAAKYLKNDLKPRVYACYHCSELVKFMDSFGGEVQQIDLNNNTLRGLTCPLNANIECAAKNAAPLIKQCGSNSKQSYSHPSFWWAKCDVWWCTAKHIEAVCGKNIARQYWQNYSTDISRLKVYGCYACLTFVQYLDNNFKIGVRQIDDKNTTLGTTCPSTLDDPECPENNVGRLIRKCERALPPNFTPQQFCEAKNKEVPCIDKHIRVICGDNIATKYLIQKNYNKIYACWYCNELVEYLYKVHENDEHNVLPIQVDDKNETLGELVCPLDNNVEPLLERCIKNVASSAKSKESGPIFCSKMNETVRCIHKHLDAVCGYESSVNETLTNAVPAIARKYCAYCHGPAVYMEELGAHLRLNDSNRAEDYCGIKFCDISLLEQLTKKFRDQKSDDECSQKYNATKNTYNTVNQLCGEEFAKEYMRDHYVVKVYACAKCKNLVNYMFEFGAKVNQTYSNDTLLGNTTCLVGESVTYDHCINTSAKPLIEECETLKANTVAFPMEFCQAMFKYVECIYENVTAVCGEEIAEKHMTKIRPETPSKNCPDCYNATDFMEKHDGHLYIKKSLADVMLYTKPYCVEPVCEKNALESTVIQTCKIEPQNTPQDTCRAILNHAQCAYREVQKLCHRNHAKDYMASDVTLNSVYPCAYCSDVIQYMETFGGTVYQAYENGSRINMTCPPPKSVDCFKINAEPLIEECRKEYLSTQLQFTVSNVSNFCSELLSSLKCIYNHIDAVCGQVVAKAYMKEETPEVASDMCQDCNDLIVFMKRHGGHVYVRDEPGNSVCILQKNEESETSKPASSYKILNDSTLNYVYLIFIVFALFSNQ